MMKDAEQRKEYLRKDLAYALLGTLVRPQFWDDTVEELITATVTAARTLRNVEPITDRDAEDYVRQRYRHVLGTAGGLTSDHAVLLAPAILHTVRQATESVLRVEEEEE